MADLILEVGGDLRPLEKEIKRVSRKGINPLNEKGFTQPLGRITGQIGEFEKSLEASNARVLAFGASAGALVAVQQGFKAILDATVDVEKRLADINVILNASSSELENFGEALFRVARSTGASFADVADAATELARQGLSVSETLQRTSDALILTRLSGMKAADSVNAITAALNSFSRAAIDSTTFVSKLAAVDAAFAVSSQDLAEAVKRVGSSAQEAGLGIDELIAAVTAAQQITARGGAVIGNSFKTIFTRIQRPRVIKELENLGIAVRGIGGTVKPAMQILQELAGTYDNLSATQKAATAELIGGVFQVNVLKAALRDLSKDYSLYGNALDISNAATDEATRRNEELNKTVAATLNKTIANLTNFGSKVGELAFGPAIKKVLGGINSAIEDFDLKDPDSFGEKIGAGVLGGIGKFLGGPGIAVIGITLIKTFTRLSKQVLDAFKTISNIGRASEAQLQAQRQVSEVLSQEPNLLAKVEDGTLDIADAHRRILFIIEQENAAQAEYLNIVKKISAVQGGKHFVNRRGDSPTFSSGYIPNFNKDKEAKQKELASASYAKPSTRAVKDKMPGVGTYYRNTAEKKISGKPFGLKQDFIVPPKGSEEGNAYRKQTSKMGIDVDRLAYDGYIPNFAKASTDKTQLPIKLTLPPEGYLPLPSWWPEVQSPLGDGGKINRVLENKYMPKSVLTPAGGGEVAIGDIPKNPGNKFPGETGETKNKGAAYRRGTESLVSLNPGAAEKFNQKVKEHYQTAVSNTATDVFDGRAGIPRTEPEGFGQIRGRMFEDMIQGLVGDSGAGGAGIDLARGLSKIRDKHGDDFVNKYFTGLPTDAAEREKVLTSPTEIRGSMATAKDAPLSLKAVKDMVASNPSFGQPPMNPNMHFKAMDTMAQQVVQGDGEVDLNEVNRNQEGKYDNKKNLKFLRKGYEFRIDQQDTNNLKYAGHIPNFESAKGRKTPLYDLDGTIIKEGFFDSNNPEKVSQITQEDLTGLGKQLASSKELVDIATARDKKNAAPIRQALTDLGINVGKVMPLASMFKSQKKPGIRKPLVNLTGPDKKRLIAEKLDRSLIDNEQKNIDALGPRGILYDGASKGYIPNYLSKGQDLDLMVGAVKRGGGKLVKTLPTIANMGEDKRQESYRKEAIELAGLDNIANLRAFSEVKENEDKDLPRSGALLLSKNWSPIGTGFAKRLNYLKEKGNFYPALPGASSKLKDNIENLLIDPRRVEGLQKQAEFMFPNGDQENKNLLSSVSGFGRDWHFQPAESIENVIRNRQGAVLGEGAFSKLSNFKSLMPSQGAAEFVGDAPDAIELATLSPTPLGLGAKAVELGGKGLHKIYNWYASRGTMNVTPEEIRKKAITDILTEKKPELKIFDESKENLVKPGLLSFKKNIARFLGKNYDNLPFALANKLEADGQGKLFVEGLRDKTAGDYVIDPKMYPARGFTRKITGGPARFLDGTSNVDVLSAAWEYLNSYTADKYNRKRDFLPKKAELDLRGAAKNVRSMQYATLGDGAFFGVQDKINEYEKVLKELQKAENEKQASQGIIPNFAKLEKTKKYGPWKTKSLASGGVMDGGLDLVNYDRGTVKSAIEKTTDLGMFKKGVLDTVQTRLNLISSGEKGSYAAAIEAEKAHEAEGGKFGDLFETAQSTQDFLGTRGLGSVSEKIKSGKGFVSAKGKKDKDGKKIKSKEIGGLGTSPLYTPVDYMKFSGDGGPAKVVDYSKGGEVSLMRPERRGPQELIKKSLHHLFRGQPDNKWKDGNVTPLETEIDYVTHADNIDKFKKLMSAGYVPNFATGLYDSDRLPSGVNRNSIIDAIVASGKPIHVFHGPAGAGKTTAAMSRYPDAELVTTLEQIAALNDFAVVSGTNRSKRTGEYSARAQSILNAASKITAVIPARSDLMDRRFGRAEEGPAAGDKRDQKGIEGTLRAPGTDYRLYADLKKQGKNVEVLRNQGFIPNFLNKKSNLIHQDGLLENEKQINSPGRAGRLTYSSVGDSNVLEYNSSNQKGAGFKQFQELVRLSRAENKSILSGSLDMQGGFGSPEDIKKFPSNFKALGSKNYFPQLRHRLIDGLQTSGNYFHESGAGEAVSFDFNSIKDLRSRVNKEDRDSYSQILSDPQLGVYIERLVSNHVKGKGDGAIKFNEGFIPKIKDWIVGKIGIFSKKNDIKPERFSSHKDFMRHTAKLMLERGELGSAEKERLEKFASGEMDFAPVLTSEDFFDVKGQEEEGEMNWGHVQGRFDRFKGMGNVGKIKNKLVKDAVNRGMSQEEAVDRIEEMAAGPGQPKGSFWTEENIRINFGGQKPNFGGLSNSVGNFLASSHKAGLQNQSGVPINEREKGFQNAIDSVTIHEFMHDMMGKGGFSDSELEPALSRWGTPLADGFNFKSTEKHYSDVVKRGGFGDEYFSTPEEILARAQQARFHLSKRDDEIGSEIKAGGKLTRAHVQAALMDAKKGVDAGPVEWDEKNIDRFLEVANRAGLSSGFVPNFAYPAYRGHANKLATNNDFANFFNKQALSQQWGRSGTEMTKSAFNFLTKMGYGNYANASWASMIQPSDFEVAGVKLSKFSDFHNLERDLGMNDGKAKYISFMGTRASVPSYHLSGDDGSFQKFGPQAQIRSGTDPYSNFGHPMKELDVSLYSKQGIQSIVNRFSESDPSLVRSGGFVPNFADPLKEAISREASAVPKSKIRVGQSPTLASTENPMGLGVYNTIHEPRGLNQGIQRARKEKRNPKTYGAAKGLVPNFAPDTDGAIDFTGVPDDVRDELVKKIAEVTHAYSIESESADEVAKEALELARVYGVSDSTIKNLNGAFKKAEQAGKDLAVKTKFEAGGLKKAFSSFKKSFMESKGSDQWESRMLALSFAVPQVTETFKQFAGRDAPKALTGMTDALGSATSTFSAIKSIFPGPSGTAVGAISSLGLAASQFAKSMQNQSEALAKQVEKSKEQFTELQNNLTSYASTFSELKSAAADPNATGTALLNLQNKLNDFAATIPPEFAMQIAGIVDPQDLETKIAEIIKKESQKSIQSAIGLDIQTSIDAEEGIITGFVDVISAHTGLLSENSRNLKQIFQGSDGQLKLQRLINDMRKGVDFTALGAEMNTAAGAANLEGKSRTEFIKVLRDQYGATADLQIILRELSNSDLKQFKESLLESARAAKQQADAIREIDIFKEVEADALGISGLRDAIDAMKANVEREAASMSVFAGGFEGFMDPKGIIGPLNQGLKDALSTLVLAPQGAGGEVKRGQGAMGIMESQLDFGTFIPQLSTQGGANFGKFDAQTQDFFKEYDSAAEKLFQANVDARVKMLQSQRAELASQGKSTAIVDDAINRELKSAGRIGTADEREAAANFRTRARKSQFEEKIGLKEIQKSQFKIGLGPVAGEAAGQTLGGQMAQEGLTARQQVGAIQSYDRLFQAELDQLDALIQRAPAGSEEEKDLQARKAKVQAGRAELQTQGANISLDRLRELGSQGVDSDDITRAGADTVNFLAGQAATVSLQGQQETPAERALRIQMEMLENQEKALEDAVKAQTDVIQQRIDAENNAASQQNAMRPGSALQTATAQAQAAAAQNENTRFGGSGIVSADEFNMNATQRAQILNEAYGTVGRSDFLGEGGAKGEAADQARAAEAKITAGGSRRQLALVDAGSKDAAKMFAQFRAILPSLDEITGGDVESATGVQFKEAIREFNKGIDKEVREGRMSQADADKRKIKDEEVKKLQTFGLGTIETARKNEGGQTAKFLKDSITQAQRARKENNQFQQTGNGYLATVASWDNPTAARVRIVTEKIGLVDALDALNNAQLEAYGTNVQQVNQLQDLIKANREAVAQDNLPEAARTQTEFNNILNNILPKMQAADTGIVSGEAGDDLASKQVKVALAKVLGGVAAVAGGFVFGKKGKNRLRFGEGGGVFNTEQARISGTRDLRRGTTGVGKISNVDEGARIAEFIATKGSGEAADQAKLLMELRGLGTSWDDAGRAVQIIDELGLGDYKAQAEGRVPSDVIEKIFDDLAKNAKTGWGGRLGEVFGNARITANADALANAVRKFSAAAKDAPPKPPEAPAPEGEGRPARKRGGTTDLGTTAYDADGKPISFSGPSIDLRGEGAAPRPRPAGAPPRPRPDGAPPSAVDTATEAIVEATEDAARPPVTETPRPTGPSVRERAGRAVRGFDAVGQAQFTGARDALNNTRGIQNAGDVLRSRVNQFRATNFMDDVMYQPGINNLTGSGMNFDEFAQRRAAAIRAGVPQELVEGLQPTTGPVKVGQEFNTGRALTQTGQVMRGATNLATETGRYGLNVANELMGGAGSQGARQAAMQRTAQMFQNSDDVLRALEAGQTVTKLLEGGQQLSKTGANTMASLGDDAVKVIQDSMTATKALDAANAAQRVAHTQGVSGAINRAGTALGLGEDAGALTRGTGKFFGTLGRSMTVAGPGLGLAGGVADLIDPTAQRRGVGAGQRFLQGVSGGQDRGSIIARGLGAERDSATDIAAGYATRMGIMAAEGAGIGSLIPGVGTAAGAVSGAVVGAAIETGSHMVKDDEAYDDMAANLDFISAQSSAFASAQGASAEGLLNYAASLQGLDKPTDKMKKALEQYQRSLDASSVVEDFGNEKTKVEATVSRFGAFGLGGGEKKTQTQKEFEESSGIMQNAISTAYFDAAESIASKMAAGIELTELEQRIQKAGSIYAHQSKISNEQIEEAQKELGTSDGRQVMALAESKRRNEIAQRGKIHAGFAAASVAQEARYAGTKYEGENFATATPEQKQLVNDLISYSRGAKTRAEENLLAQMGPIGGLQQSKDLLSRSAQRDEGEKQRLMDELSNAYGGEARAGGYEARSRMVGMGFGGYDMEGDREKLRGFLEKRASGSVEQDIFEVAKTGNVKAAIDLQAAREQYRSAGQGAGGDYVRQRSLDQEAKIRKDLALQQGSETGIGLFQKGIIQDSSGEAAKISEAQQRIDKRDAAREQIKQIAQQVRDTAASEGRAEREGEFEAALRAAEGGVRGDMSRAMFGGQKLRTVAGFGEEKQGFSSSALSSIAVAEVAGEHAGINKGSVKDMKTVEDGRAWMQGLAQSAGIISPQAITAAQQSLEAARVRTSSQQENVDFAQGTVDFYRSKPGYDASGDAELLKNALEHLATQQQRLSEATQKQNQEQQNLTAMQTKQNTFRGFASRGMSAPQAAAATQRAGNIASIHQERMGLLDQMGGIGTEEGLQAKRNELLTQANQIESELGSGDLSREEQLEKMRQVRGLRGRAEALGPIDASKQAPVAFQQRRRQQAIASENAMALRNTDLPFSMEYAQFIEAGNKQQALMSDQRIALAGGGRYNLGARDQVIAARAGNQDVRYTASTLKHLGAKGAGEAYDSALEGAGVDKTEIENFQRRRRLLVSYQRGGKNMDAATAQKMAQVQQQKMQEFQATEGFNEALRQAIVDGFAKATANKPAGTQETETATAQPNQTNPAGPDAPEQQPQTQDKVAAGNQNIDVNQQVTIQHGNRIEMVHSGSVAGLMNEAQLQETASHIFNQLNEKLQQGFSVEDAIRKSATDGGNQAT